MGLDVGRVRGEEVLERKEERRTEKGEVRVLGQ